MMKYIIILSVLFSAVACGQNYNKRDIAILNRVDVGAGTLPALAQGYEWRVDDTLFVRVNGATIKYWLGAGTHLQVMQYDSVAALWRPGTIVTDSASAATVSWSNLANATSHQTYNFSTWRMSMYGDLSAGVAAYTWFGAGGAATSKVTDIYTNSGPAKPLQVTAQGNANGVYMDSTAKFTYMGSGTINANLWKGLTVIPSADLDAQIAYKNTANTFTVGQTVNVTGAATGLNVSAVSGSGVYAAATTGAALYGYASSSGAGVWANSVAGTGLLAQTSSGTIADFWYGGASQMKITYHKIAPGSDAVVNLGSDTARYDTLFTQAIAGKVYGTSQLTSGDSVTVYIPGATTSTVWICQAFFTGGQSDADGTLRGYFTTDSLHIRSELSQTIPNLNITYSAERIEP